MPNSVLEKIISESKSPEDLNTALLSAIKKAASFQERITLWNYLKIRATMNDLRWILVEVQHDKDDSAAMVRHDAAEMLMCQHNAVRGSTPFVRHPSALEDLVLMYRHSTSFRSAVTSVEYVEVVFDRLETEGLIEHGWRQRNADMTGLMLGLHTKH